jgi:hypothetical protein
MTPPECTCQSPEDAKTKGCALPGMIPGSQRSWELCSGKCPDDNPCTPEVSSRYRALKHGFAPAAPAAAVQPIPPSRTTGGVGTELKHLFAKLGIASWNGCGCNNLADLFDRQGPEWCHDHFDQILGMLKTRSAQLGWRSKISAAALSFTTGLAFKINPLNPLDGLLKEAIRLAVSSHHQTVS